MERRKCGSWKVAYLLGGYTITKSSFPRQKFFALSIDGQTDVLPTDLDASSTQRYNARVARSVRTEKESSCHHALHHECSGAFLFYDGS